MKQPTSLDDVVPGRELVLFLVVLAVGLMVFISTLYKPQITKYEILNVQVEALEKQKEEILKFQQAMRKRTPTKTEIVTPLANVHLQILSGARAPAIATLTELVGTITSDEFLGPIRLESIGYDPVQEKLGYAQTAIKVKAAGSYRDIVDYLARLEHLEILIHLKKLSLAQDKSGASDIIVEWEADYYEMREGESGHAA